MNSMSDRDVTAEASDAAAGDAAPSFNGDQVLGFVFLALALAILVGGVGLYRWAAVGSTPPDPPLAFRIDVNTADEPTLQLLPGVGPALSQRIIEERQRRPFGSADDLQRVNGIGPRLAERIAPYVIFHSRTPPQAGPERSEGPGHRAGASRTDLPGP